MRIQILPLPSVVVGDDVQEPFALIVDQHDSDVDETTAEAWQQFKTSAGARALLITPDTVEVVDRYAEPAPQAREPLGAKAPTLYAAILDELVADIENGTYPVGALLPSIRDMAERWAVSTTTTRRVLAELVAAGYARPDGTRGHIVTKPPPPQPIITLDAPLDDETLADLRKSMPHAFENDGEGCCATCGLGRFVPSHMQAM